MRRSDFVAARRRSSAQKSTVRTDRPCLSSTASGTNLPIRNVRFHGKFWRVSGRATEIAKATFMTPTATWAGLKCRSAAALCRSEVCYPFCRKHGRHRAVKRRDVHHADRRRRGAWPLAARAQQAERDAADRRIDRLFRERPGSTGPRRGVPRGAPEARVDGGSQHPDRRALGDVRRGVDATIRAGTRRAAARTHSLVKQTHHRGAAASNAHHPHHFRHRCRSGRQRLRRELSAAGRQRHRFHRYSADDRGQVAGAAQGDRAARRPGRLPVQPGNGATFRILSEPLQSRRCVVRSGGDRRTCSRQVRARTPSLPHRHARRMAA